MPAPRFYSYAKRTFDLGLALLLLVLLAPLILVVAVLIFLQDFHSPFFIGERIGRNMRPFRMVKFRSMVLGAHKSGTQSTAGDDARITPIGALIRRFKLDEIPQLFNVLKGEMSFVGPRPNVASEVALYSPDEKRLLSVRPGITDFASIVFADEGDILRGSADPDRDYNLLIRPRKSHLGLHYLEAASFRVDATLGWLTFLAAIRRRRALRGVRDLLMRTGADETLAQLATRTNDLAPTLPPGVDAADWSKHIAHPSIIAKQRNSS
jgi:lipopolysaccharide/colanic/teichoic acid biosynthesis glycosyltransferase